uniref:Uncharacterized protein n=1 Tax=Octopus bimaculoides TaxID=37653 RepID=A0A0L8HQC2_OCTBM
MSEVKVVAVCLPVCMHACCWSVSLLACLPACLLLACLPACLLSYLCVRLSVCLLV